MWIYIIYPISLQNIFPTKVGLNKMLDKQKIVSNNSKYF